MSKESLGEIAKIMQSNQGVGGGHSSYDRSDEDWSCSGSVQNFSHFRLAVFPI